MLLLYQELGELRKENFNLKLRIYFLEERVKTKYNKEDVIQTVRIVLSSICRKLQSFIGYTNFRLFFSNRYFFWI